MITKSAKKSVHEGHERPSHVCGSGPALPAVSPRRLPILRDRRGHADERVPRGGMLAHLGRVPSRVPVLGLAVGAHSAQRCPPERSARAQREVDEGLPVEMPAQHLQEEFTCRAQRGQKL